jgi:hypothetical protein
MPAILATAATALALASSLAPIAAPADPACGTTWIDFQRAEGELSIRAGFDMPLDVDTVHLRVRGLAHASGLAQPSIPFEVSFDESGLPSEWEGVATAQIPGSGGGSGHLAIDSYVVLANGATCDVGGPRATF